MVVTSKHMKSTSEIGSFQKVPGNKTMLKSKHPWLSLVSERTNFKTFFCVIIINFHTSYPSAFRAFIKPSFYKSCIQLTRNKTLGKVAKVKARQPLNSLFSRSAVKSAESVSINP